MRIQYSNGRIIEVSDEDEARAIIDADYPDAVYGEEWEPSKFAGSRERLLVWRDERDAGPLGVGDAGQSSVAEILRGEALF